MTVDAQVIPIDESAAAAVQTVGVGGGLAVVGVGEQLPEAISSDDDVNDEEEDDDDHGKPDQQHQRRQQQQQQPQQQHRGEQLQRQQSLGSPGVCRICHSDCWAKGPLISPCRCKGTLAHVHLSCLERWLNQSCRNYCELCNFRYNALETQRYGWFEALRLWINHPRNRGHIRADLLIFVLLTVFTAGLSSVCLIGSRYFVQEGVKVGYTETWARGTVTIFMIIVIFGYSVAVVFLIKNQAVPWYRWWRGTVNVHLLLDSASELRRLQHQQRLNDLADEQR